jgi:hypothetical protein
MTSTPPRAATISSLALLSGTSTGTTAGQNKRHMVKLFPQAETGATNSTGGSVMNHIPN